MRTSVYADPLQIEQAAKEFEHLEKYLIEAEKYMGRKFFWGSFAIVVMPPNFLYAGSENPLITLVSPTTIVGDKSAVMVAIHNICHSWSGN